MSIYSELVLSSCTLLYLFKTVSFWTKYCRITPLIQSSMKSNIRWPPSGPFRDINGTKQCIYYLSQSVPPNDWLWTHVINLNNGHVSNSYSTCIFGWLDENSNLKLVTIHKYCLLVTWFTTFWSLDSQFFG